MFIVSALKLVEDGSGLVDPYPIGECGTNEVGDGRMISCSLCFVSGDFAESREDAPPDSNAHQVVCSE